MHFNKDLFMLSPSRFQSKPAAQRGFTLIELLVVLAILTLQIGRSVV